MNAQAWWHSRTGRAPAWLARLGWHPVAVYTALAALILGPALAPGYILLLDMVFAPTLRFTPELDHLTLYRAVMAALNVIIPSWVLQKLLLLSILLLAGLGMHRLIPVDNPWARYAAGIFYLVNPFTYGRLMAGQFLVLAGYALLPWLLAALLRLVRAPGKGTALHVGLWISAIGFVSLHTLGFAALLTAIMLAAGLLRARRRPPLLRRLLAWSAVAAALVLMLHSYWLMPLLTRPSVQDQLVGAFDTRHHLSFRTEGHPLLGVPGNVLALHGFWLDRQHFYVPPQAAAPYWPLLWLVLLALMGAGAVWGWQRGHRLLVATLGLTLTISWVLAQGIMDSPFAPFNYWLVEHVPLYRGYREPGKFIALIALAEACFIGLGAAALLGWLSRRRRTTATRLAPVLLLALPFLYTPVMAWGAGGQLRAVDYPADWYALNRRLGAEPSAGRVLFLPWHQYLHLGFASRVIANPAPQFFDRPVIAGDNSEIGLIERQTDSLTSRLIEERVLSADKTRLGRTLAQLNIQYIVLAKEADYADYDWLGRQPELELIHQNASLKLYQYKGWQKNL